MFFNVNGRQIYIYHMSLPFLGDKLNWPLLLVDNANLPFATICVCFEAVSSFD